MKNTRRRSFALYILVLGFLFGLVVLTFKLITNSNTWALSSVNRHVSGIGLSNSGKVLDKNNVILAQSLDNKRNYHTDEKIRKSMLHTVGDGTSQITTSIQSLYKAELYGYNFITGINCPNFLSVRKNVKLTLDSDVCKVALDKLGNTKGAVAVYNYKTGDIICMVSTPTYDPYSPPIIKGDNDEMYAGAYLNRVLSSTYTPGSIFKIVTAASGFENISSIDNKTFNCEKTFKVNNGDITCMSSHGNIDFKNAFAKSCNIYFSKLAIELGSDKMTNTANSLGFNKSFNINKAQTKASKYDVKSSNDYYLGWSGIGQHNDLVNPMHMLILMGAIANQGTAIMPNMIEEIVSDNAFSFLTNSSKKTQTVNFMQKETASKLKDIMRHAVKNNYGDSLFKDLTVCAKTGTAEVGENKDPHAWMVGFATNEEHPLAFVVIAENAGFGLKSAGPIAKSVMAAAIKNSSD